MLVLNQVRVAYNRLEVVHGVDLEVKAGEVVGIVGPNGAGKSSLLHAICGLRPPSAGDVQFERASLVGRTPEQIARLGVALVPEGRRIFGTLSVAENLMLGEGAHPRGESNRVLGRFPILGDRASQRADRLSGGEQQQLALARALLGNPKLLILDEPSFGLAPKMIDSIYEVLNGLREEGVTMLLVEQNATRTIDFCDRCLVMSGGEVCLEGRREELQREAQLLRAYLGGQL